MEGVRAKLTDVNPHLVCVLCHGYFVDATTIAECLHSFCRSCIFRHLERKPICPICEVAVHNTKLHRSLRPDKTLQDIVYKLVPGLYRNEMQRRREFYEQHPFRDEYLEPECRGVGLDRVIYSPDDLVSISLEFYDEDREREEWNNNNVFQKPVPIKKPLPGSKRYLQCPAGFKMRHLKKFIRQKCGLSENCEVEVIYRKESLPDSYSLMDIAYIYTWKKNEPMRFYYKLPDVPMKTLDVAKALASHVIVQELLEPLSQCKMDIDPVEPSKNGIPTVSVPNEETPLSNPVTAENKLPGNDENVKNTDVAHRKSSKSNGEQQDSSKAVRQKVNGLKVTSKNLGPSKDHLEEGTVPSETKKALESQDPTPPPSPVPSVTPDGLDSNVTSSVPSVNNAPPITTHAQLQGITASEPTTTRTITKQELPAVSVLLSLGNCAPEIKRPLPIEAPSPRPEPKFILPKPVEGKHIPIVDQLLIKKMSSKSISKTSVNKIASELAETKSMNGNVFKTPLPKPKPQLAPFSQNPLILSTPQMGLGTKLADPSVGNRTPFHNSQVDPTTGYRTPFSHSHAEPAGNQTPFHHSSSPQHLPVYPPPMMPPLSKAMPWKDTSKDQSRFSLFPQSPRHVPQYPNVLPKDKKRNGKSTDNSKPSQDPFLFATNETETPKKDPNERLGHVEENSHLTTQQSSLTSSPPKQVNSNHDENSAGLVHNGPTSQKTDRPEVTVNTSNGSLTISAQIPKPAVISNNEPSDVKTKSVPPQVLQKNLSGQRLNGNGLVAANKKKSGLKNKQKDGLENKNGDAELQKVLGSGAGNKNLSLSRKSHLNGSGLLIPGGVVSRTGPTLDQRLQQLYKSNSRPPVNTQSPSQKMQPVSDGKQQSRLASWLNSRFNSNTKPPSPSNDKAKKPEVIIDKVSQESATEKLGKEMSMLKKKLDELRKTSEGCEITQENPSPDADKKIRDVTPSVSIEFMKAADMKKLDVGNNKSKDKGVKRPVPGLKAIQDVDVKKMKMSPEDEETKKPKGDKKLDQEALDLSGSGKPSDELAHRIALLQSNGALSNQQQFNWLLNRPLIAGQQFPRAT